MKDYSAFVDVLRQGLQSVGTVSSQQWQQQTSAYLDGMAATELRRLVQLPLRRQYGSFFTSSSLAHEVFHPLKETLRKDSKIYDPGMGAGNLLIYGSNLLNEKFGSVQPTECLFGTDVHPEFVKAADLRLQLCTIKQMVDAGVNTEAMPALPDLSNNLMTLDATEQNTFYQNATHIVLNPPFHLIQPKKGVSWSDGKVSMAALFIDCALAFSRQDVQITAILPEVLRSGSRYEKWRNIIEKKCSIERVRLHGQFDSFTDIDVFSLQLTKRKKVYHFNSSAFNTSLPVNQAYPLLEDIFEVSVGTVVDNRDPHEGPTRPYLKSREISAWKRYFKVDSHRQHQGKSVQGPFVIVKRTSRKGDAGRAQASIITIPEPVYVDNHLLVLVPRSGLLKDCMTLVTLLRDRRTDQWIDQVIRCRHLTVRVMSKIPLWLKPPKRLK